MNAGHDLLTVGIIIFLTRVSTVVIAKCRRCRAAARSQALLAPCRSSLITVASGEDDHGLARSALCALPAPIWVGPRPSVVAFLPKVQGIPVTTWGS